MISGKKKSIMKEFQWKAVETNRLLLPTYLLRLFKMGGLIQIKMQENKEGRLAIKYSTGSLLCKFAKRDKNQDNFKL